MKLRIILALVAGALALSAADDPKKASKPTKPPAGAEPWHTLTIPPGAKEVGPYTYRYTDAKGKKWIYRQTPFGVVRIEDAPAVAAPAGPPPPIKVVEDGDVYHFEMPTPFGPQKWTKKKTDLNDNEKAAVERAREKQGAAAKPGAAGEKK